MWFDDINARGEDRVEKQIFLNSDLELILSAEPKDGRYHDLLFYIENQAKQEFKEFKIHLSDTRNT